MTPELLNNIGMVVGAVLTLAIFSYLLGDNFLYRIAVHILVGAAAAFILITVVESVLIPWVNQTILAQPVNIPNLILGVVPFIIGLLLLFKFSPRTAGLGNLGLVIVLGVGTAIALFGAIVGTLFPLVLDVTRNFRPGTVLDGLVILIGTVSVLVYFTYLGVRRPNGELEQRLPIRAVGVVGQIFITITLGATYGLLITSALTVLTSTIAERLLILLPK